MPDTPTRPNERQFSVIRAGKETGMPRGFNYELLWAKDTQTLWIQTPSGKVKVGGPGFLGQDEKVKADDTDPEAGYLSNKVDDTTIKVNTTTYKIYAVDDSSIQKVRWLEDGTERGIRSVANLKPTSTVSVAVADNAADNRVDIQLSTPDDRSNQRVKVLVSGTEIGTRRAINFIPDGSVTITGADNDTDNRVNITISSTGGGSSTDEKVKTDAADPTAGYLDAKVDNTTIKVNTSTHKLYAADATTTSKGVIQLAGHLSGTANSPTVVDNTSNQRIRVLDNGTLIGTRRAINFQPGTGISFNITDDFTNDRVNVQVSSTGSTVDEKVKANATDPTAGYLDAKVDDTTIKVNTSTYKLYVPNSSSIQRIEVARDGTIYSTRSRININANNWASWTVTDDATNNRANIVLIPNVGVQNNGTVVAYRPNINFVPTNTSNLSITDDSGNNRVNVSISPRVSSSGSIVETTSGLALADDNNSGTDRYYTTNSTGARVWAPKPFTVVNNQALLNAVVNITASSSPGNILDAGGSNPIFQQVVLPGVWHVIFHVEAGFGITTSGVGTAQIIFGIYKREGTTDTLIVNVRLAWVQTPGAQTTPRMFFSVDKSIFFNATYSGTSTDIRSNTVTGTVLFARIYYTTSGSVSSIDLAQVFSTSTIDAIRAS
jgi:hypothetical protein